MSRNGQTADRTRTERGHVRAIITSTATATAHTPSVRRTPASIPDDCDDWLELLSESRHAAAYAQKITTQAKIYYFAEATSKTRSAFRGTPGIGPDITDAVEAGLRRKGLSFADDPHQKPRTPTSGEALDAWMAMLAGRWPTDGPAAAALRAIGGSSAVRARTSFDEPRLRDRFIATYDHHHQEAAK